MRNKLHICWPQRNCHQDCRSCCLKSWSHHWVVVFQNQNQPDQVQLNQCTALYIIRMSFVLCVLILVYIHVLNRDPWYLCYGRFLLLLASLSFRIFLVWSMSSRHCSKIISLVRFLVMHFCNECCLLLVLVKAWKVRSILDSDLQLQHHQKQTLWQQNAVKIASQTRRSTSLKLNFHQYTYHIKYVLIHITFIHLFNYN